MKRLNVVLCIWVLAVLACGNADPDETSNQSGKTETPTNCLTFDPVCPEGSAQVNECPTDALCKDVGLASCNPIRCAILLPLHCLTYEPKCPDGSLGVDDCPPNGACSIVGQDSCSGPLVCVEDFDETR